MLQLLRPLLPNLSFLLSTFHFECPRYFLDYALVDSPQSLCNRSFRSRLCVASLLSFSDVLVHLSLDWVRTLPFSLYTSAFWLDSTKLITGTMYIHMTLIISTPAINGKLYM